MTPMTTELSYLTLLDQTAIWRSWGSHGGLTTHRITDMDTRFQRTVLAWLREHATFLHGLRTVQLTGTWKTGADRIDARDQHGASIDLLAHRALDPAVWLEEQPLVQHLARLVPHRGAPARGILARARRRWGR